MRKLINFLVSLGLAMSLSACSLHRPVIPTMDLPPEPTKPKIQSSVIVQNNIPWVAYSMNDSLRLYEYLLHKDVYERELRNRIESMNKIMVK